MPPAPPEQEDFHGTLKLIRSAIDFVTQLRVAPTPNRVAVVYCHLGNLNEELSQAINRLLSRDKLTAQAFDEIYDQYFGHMVDNADLRDASRRFERTVGEVSDCIGNAKGKAEHFGSVLTEFANQASAGSALSSIEAVLAETRDMAEANNVLSERLSASSREILFLREHLERLEREASIDALTGIANRKAFDTQLRKAVVEAGRSSTPLCLLMIDIDYFKQFNDTHGHVLGDQVLKLVARTMTECIKLGDVPARYGGEEFSVILPGSSLTQAIATADSIRVHVASKRVVNKRTGITLGTITLSAGAAMFRPGETAGGLVHRADEALYAAKGAGRNRVISELAIT